MQTKTTTATAAGLYKHNTGVPHPQNHLLRTGFREGKEDSGRFEAGRFQNPELGVRLPSASPLGDLRIAPERPSLTLLAPAKTETNRDKAKKKRRRLTEGAQTTTPSASLVQTPSGPLHNHPHITPKADIYKVPATVCTSTEMTWDQP